MSKKCEPANRSSKSMIWAAVSGLTAISTIPHMMRLSQARSGIFASVMPRQRMDRIVVMMFAAVAIEPKPPIMMPRIQ